MRVGSLFTGYGGLDMAVGGELVWYAEIEKAACQVLAAHHPGILNLGDITKINWADVEPVDILTGGYPCQPFSHAGNRKGKNDERHLWPYVLTAICAIRPRYAILENVSGHLSLGFDSVLTDLAEIGWAAEWGTYRASDVGAPHRRERLFIVACNPDNDGTFASERGQSLREGAVTGRQQQHQVKQWELARGSDSLVAYATRGTRGAGSGRGVSKPERATRLATHVGDIAADTDNTRPANESLTRQPQQSAPQSDFNIAANASGDGYGEQLHAGAIAGVEGQATGSTQQRQRSRRESDSRGVVATADTEHDGWNGRTITRGVGESQDQRRLQQSERRDPDIAADTVSEYGQLAEERFYSELTDSDRGQRNAADTDSASGETPIGRPRPRDAGRLQLVERGGQVDWGKYAPAIQRWEVVLDRPAPAPTVQRKDKRRLNPQFVEWMMGLPDGWVTGHGLSAAQELKMLGNGVVPQQARAAITQLMQRVEA